MGIFIQRVMDENNEVDEAMHTLFFGLRMEHGYRKFRDVQLAVSGLEGLEDSLHYHTESTGFFINFPPVLHINLLRFDNTHNIAVKSNDRFTFPLEFDATPYLMNNADDFYPLYCLHSVVVHRGDLHRGHYFAFIRTNEDTGEFHCFDDHVVTSATMETVVEKNFGGNGNTNAYVLVYVQKRPASSVESTTEQEGKSNLSNS